MAEATTYTGTVDTLRTAYQTLTSKDKYSAVVRWACFTKTPFTQACGVEGFGVDGMKNLQAFGAARPTGRIVRIDSGNYALRGSIFATHGTSFHVGRLGSTTPELVEGGDEWAYSWHEMRQAQYIPLPDVEDNGAGEIDIKIQKQEGMKQLFVEDFNYAILGSSSAPDYGTMGPSAVYHDMPNLISVTQTRTVGAISTTNAFWENGCKAVTSIGGGGEMDRPITLRRAWLDQLNDQMAYSEGSDDYLFLCSQGAWQYYDRLMYADSVQGGNGGAFGTYAKYDAAGIQNKAFSGRPVVWDPAVTVPYGATASTESVYGIHIPSFFLSIRGEANFKFSGWELPREHDQYKTLVASLRLRYTPGVTARRPHFVLYNIPANSD